MPRTHVLTLCVLFLSTMRVVDAQSNDELRRQLEESRRAQADMMRMLEEQSQRIAKLESERGSSTSPPAPGTPSPTLPPTTQGDVSSRPVTWGDIIRGKNSSFRVYGFARADAIYDSSRANNSQLIGFVKSEDPDAPAGIGAPNNADNFTLHPRLTRLGIDITGPEIATLMAAKSKAKVEIDFYGGGSESRAIPRMRHAYLELAWGSFSVLAGQTADVIAPLFPAANPDLVMWGAGNLGDRRPQFRLTWAPEIGPGKLTWQGAIGLPSAIDAKDLDPATSTGAGFRDGETSGDPVLQTRIAYSLPWFWEKQRAEIGGWMHRAWDEPDTSFPTGVDFGDDDVFDSYALGLDLMLPIWEDKAWFKGEIWYGKNLTDVRGGNFQGINTATGDEIYARGGFAELGLKFIPMWTTSFGYSNDDPTDGDLGVGGRVDNTVFYIANKWHFDPVTLGFDWQNWRTDYKGYQPGTNDRFQWYLQFDF